MSITIVLGVSVLLQVFTIGVALSMVRMTGRWRAWLSIAAAVILMAVPRSITFFKLITGQMAEPPSLEAELIALDTSFMLVIGLAWIPPLFRSLQRSRDDLMRSQLILVDSENRLKILFENAPDAIYILDLFGRFVDMNRATLELTGHSRKELIGNRFEDIDVLRQTPEEDSAKGTGAHGHPGSPDQGEYVVHRKDGSQIILEVRVYPVKIHDEDLVLGIARDISGRKLAQQEKELLEEQLRRTQKLETIGTLAGGIAHDFNNILTPILGYTDMIKHTEPVESDNRMMLEHVIQAAQRAKELVQQILIFGRHVEQERRPIKLESIVKEALRLLRASLPATIEIRQNTNNSCGAVLADPSQIHQVVMNLCTNAFHAMKENGGVLEIGVDSVDVGPEMVERSPQLNVGTYVKLMVRDSGHGMDKSTLERIFEPFFTTKNVGEGTGLGLSVVHGIVANHGGEILVRSEPGKGSTFEVYLPQVMRDADSNANDNSPTPTGSERVLLVDDEKEIALMGKRMLERLGYNVTVRTASYEALEAFRACPDKFDVIIADQTMPQLTGVRMVEEIRKIRYDIPVILMSGFSETISSENCHKFGIDEFVMKPIIARDLSRAIRRVLDPDSSVIQGDQLNT